MTNLLIDHVSKVLGTAPVLDQVYLRVQADNLISRNILNCTSNPNQELI